MQLLEVVTILILQLQDINPTFTSDAITEIQDFISYIGGVVSSLFLLITIVTYLFTK